VCPVKSVLLQDGEAFTASCLDEFQPGTYALAISGAALAASNHSREFITALQHLIHNQPAALLVFECTSLSEQSHAISDLTSAAVSGIRQLAEREVRFGFPQGGQSLSGQLAGLEFSGGYPGETEEPVSHFELANETAAEVIMAANERPVFVRMSIGILPGLSLIHAHTRSE
jgi:hypothetical protein